MDLAPIILFVYKRPQHTQATLDALAANTLAKESALYVFCDGPKANMSATALEELIATRALVANENRFKTIRIVEQKENKGLANSIVAGVTEVVNKHGKAIIIEDDIVTASSCLTYFNQALELYENETKVFSVSAYKPPAKPFNSEDSFFLPFSFPWGWAVWKRSWDNFMPDSHLLKQQIDNRGLKAQLNLGYYPYYEMLENDIAGKVSSWFVRFYAYHLLNDGLCLYPGVSLTKNVGFDSTGEHCNNEDTYFSGVPFGNIQQITKKDVVLQPKIWKVHVAEFRDRDPHPPFLFRARRKLMRILKKLISNV